jgi:hypothetical protein
MHDFNERIDAIYTQIKSVEKRSSRKISKLHEQVTLLRKQRFDYLSEQTGLVVGEYRYMSDELTTLWKAHDSSVDFYIRRHHGEFKVLNLDETPNGFTAELGTVPHQMMRITVNVEIVHKCKKADV